MAYLFERTRLHLANPAFSKRLLSFLLLFGVVWIFRHIAVLFVSFLLFSHALGFLGRQAARLFRGNHRYGILLSVFLLVLLAGGGGWIFFHTKLRFVLQQIPQWLDHQIPQWLNQGQDPSVFINRIASKLPAWMHGEELLKWLTHKAHLYVTDNKAKVTTAALSVLQRLLAAGGILIQVLIGFVLALVYQLDPKPVHAFLQQFREQSITGICKQYLGYCADAILITVKLQVLVALINTILTLPVLFLLHLPHRGLLILVIFLSSLVPILGNFVSGAVLVVVSYFSRGFLGVAVFLAITFVLHKLEVYYLNPRLSARHVQLPILILACSLIAFEHLFGWVGVFLSFPCLYVGIKIYQDWKPWLSRPGESNAIQPITT